MTIIRVTKPSITTLQVVPSLQGGGAEHVAAYLASYFSQPGLPSIAAFKAGPVLGYLSKRGVVTELAESQWATRLTTSLKHLQKLATRPKIDAETIQRDQHNILTRSPRNLNWLRKLLEANHYDVVHLHHLSCALLAEGIRKFTPRIIYTHHNILTQRHSQRDIEALCEALRYVDQVICPTEFCKRDFSAATGYSNVCVVSNPSFLSAKGEPSCRTRLKHIGTASTLRSSKGIGTLLEGWRMYENPEEYTLLVAGGDPSAVAHWRRESCQLGLKRIEFLGELRHEQAMISFYERLGLLIAPSKTESFGLQVIEAMSRGIPVIASDIPAFRELLGAEGLFFHPDRPAELATIISSLVQDKIALARSGKSGRDRWMSRFHPNQILELTGRLYQEHLSS